MKKIIPYLLIVSAFTTGSVCVRAQSNEIQATGKIPINHALDQTLIDVARDGRTDKVGKGDVDKIASLLRQGADPNAKNAQGSSLANYVQTSRLVDTSEQGKWKLKVNTFLDQHGKPKGQ